MNLPNLILGGAPKSGTSSLYFWLAAHPEVFASQTKETFFFADKVNHFNKHCNCIEHNIEDYSNYFKKASPKNKILFEATAAYLYSKNALHHFSKFNPPPKIIFILREPSAQIYSHYKMEKYRTKKTSLNLQEYIQLPKIDMYVNYPEFLKKWIQNYPKGLIKILIFEDVIENKKLRMQEIADFLQINTSFYTDFQFEHRNESINTRSSLLHHIGTKIQPLIPHQLQSKILPIYLKLNSKKTPKITASDKSILLDLKTKYSFIKDDLKKIDSTLQLESWEV